LPAKVSWLAAAGPSEVPTLFAYVVVLSNLPAYLDGEITGIREWVSGTVAALTVVGLAVLVVRALRARRAAEVALAAQLGARWREQIRPEFANRLRRRRPWARMLLMPWPFRPRSVVRFADIAYGENGEENRLDVYRHRSRPEGAPTLLYFHGGGFTWGRKNFEARPLLHHLARQGWTCVSANYHLARSPIEGFPQHLIDAKRAIAWVRTHGAAHGVDPDNVFVAGSSAGAHLTAMASLTPGKFQPGFESADTGVRAGIGLYGYYGALGDDGATSTAPAAYVHGAATPFLIVHGTNDTYTPLEGAGQFVEALSAASPSAVALVALPGAQHSFDLFHSIRFETVVDTVEAFAAWIRSQGCVTAPAPRSRHGDDGVRRKRPRRG
jgi:acetyl esterase/lipase